MDMSELYYTNKLLGISIFDHSKVYAAYILQNKTATHSTISSLDIHGHLLILSLSKKVNGTVTRHAFAVVG